jgi:hypothetical protein
LLERGRSDASGHAGHPKDEWGVADPTSRPIPFEI